MKAFEDNKGRTWVLDITVSAIRRIRELANIDFGKPQTITDGTTMNQIAGDFVKLADVLYAALLPKLEQSNISRDDFCDSISGDAINNSTYALLEAIADFFPKAQAELLKKIISSARAQQERTEKEAAETVARTLELQTSVLLQKNSQGQ